MKFKMIHDQTWSDLLNFTTRPLICTKWEERLLMILSKIQMDTGLRFYRKAG